MGHGPEDVEGRGRRGCRVPWTHSVSHFLYLSDRVPSGRPEVLYEPGRGVRRKIWEWVPRVSPAPAGIKGLGSGRGGGWIGVRTQSVCMSVARAPGPSVFGPGLHRYLPSHLS